MYLDSPEVGATEGKGKSHGTEAERSKKTLSRERPGEPRTMFTADHHEESRYLELDMAREEEGEELAVFIGERSQRMTHNPVYDYPEPYANPRREALSLPREISLVGRLRLTEPVWLQLGINSATALHILQREPPGTFLVRRSNTRQCQVLCLRLPDNSAPAFVTTYRLHQDRAVIWLDGSDLTFPGLLHLIASYCSTPDILPLSLRLPQPIWEASSCQQLEAIAHLGLEFWSSSLNTKAFGKPVPPALPSHMGEDPSLDPAGNVRRDFAQPVPGKPTRTPGLPNPLLSGPPSGDVGVRRQYFKNHIKVQVSTEAVSPLSPPAAPPPPIPIGRKMRRNPPSPPARRSQNPNPSPLPDGSSPAVVTLEGYCIPPSKEPGGQSGGTLDCVASPDHQHVMEEGELESQGPETKDLDRFLWKVSADESGNGGQDVMLSSSGPS